VGFLCRHYRGSRSTLRCAIPSRHAGPWAIPLCGTANAASDDAEALKLTPMGASPGPMWHIRTLTWGRMGQGSERSEASVVGLNDGVHHCFRGTSLFPAIFATRSAAAASLPLPRSIPDRGRCRSVKPPAEFPVMLSPFVSLRVNCAKHLCSSLPRLSGQSSMRTAEILRRPKGRAPQDDRHMVRVLFPRHTPPRTWDFRFNAFEQTKSPEEVRIWVTAGAL